MTNPTNDIIKKSRSQYLTRTEFPSYDENNFPERFVTKYHLWVTSAWITIPSNAFAAEFVGISYVRPALDSFLSSLCLLFLFRTVISWYPKIDLNKPPYNFVAWPTEPLLKPVREIIPPAFGVDVSPLVYIFVLSFIREILSGPQGILSLAESS